MHRAPHRNPRSWIALAFGSVALGTGLAWMLAVEWGVAPLDAFIAGSARITGLTVGTLIILLSIVFVAAAWLLGSRMGVGTPITFITVGIVVDLWSVAIVDALQWSPADWPLSTRIAIWCAGFVLFAIGVVSTLASDLGASPYDQIVRVVHEKFGISLAVSRLIFDAVILAGAFLIGGAWGIGTVALLLLMPIALGWLAPRFHGWVHPLRHDESTHQVNAGGVVQQ